MASVGIIDIGMRLTTDKLESGLTRTKKSLASFGAGIGSLKGALVGLAGAAGIGLSIGALASMTRQQMITLDGLAKLSDRLGMVPADLAALQNAAQKSGLGVDNFNDALNDLQEKMGEAKTEASEVRTAFEQLGISTEDLAGMGTTDALKAVADGLKGIPDPAMKSYIAVKLMGESGRKMVTMLDGGAEAIDQFVENGKNLGATFTRLDLAKVELANNAIIDISTGFDNLKNLIAIEVSPIVMGLAEDFKAMGSGGWDAAGMIRSGLEGVVWSVGMVSDIVHTLKLGFHAAQLGITRGIAYLFSGFSKMGDAIIWLTNLIPGFENNTVNSLSIMAEEMHKTADGLKKDFLIELSVSPPSEKIGRWIDDKKAKANELAKATANASDEFKNFDPARLAAFNLEMDKLRDQIEMVGMTDLEKKLFELDGDAPKEIRDLLRELETANFGQRIKDEAKTGFQALREELNEVSKLKTAEEREFAFNHIKQRETQNPVKALSMGLDDIAAKQDMGLYDEEDAKRAKMALMDSFSIPPDVVERTRMQIAELQEMFLNDHISEEQLKLGRLSALPDFLQDAFESAITPLDKLKEKLEQLQKLKLAGVINQEELEQAAGYLQRELMGRELQLGSAAEFGSAEAMKRITAHQYNTNDPMKSIEKINKEQLTELRRLNTREDKKPQTVALPPI